MYTHVLKNKSQDITSCRQKPRGLKLGLKTSRSLPTNGAPEAWNDVKPVPSIGGPSAGIFAILPPMLAIEVVRWGGTASNAALTSNIDPVTWICGTNQEVIIHVWVFGTGETCPAWLWVFTWDHSETVWTGWAWSFFSIYHSSWFNQKPINHPPAKKTERDATRAPVCHVCGNAMNYHDLWKENCLK